MRVMVCVPANKDSEAGVMPPAELVAKMQAYNEQLVKAGVMLAGDGLTPTSKAKRVRFDGDKRTVIDGPFAESKELISGYALLELPSKAAAIEWAVRYGVIVRVNEVEVRQVLETPPQG